MLKISLERLLRTPTARRVGQFLDDKAAHVGLGAFLVERIRAVVPDVRVSHRHDLPAIRRIGQDLLITGHRGVEANFADARAGGAKGFAFESSAVFESEERAHDRENVERRTPNVQRRIAETNSTAF